MALKSELTELQMRLKAARQRKASAADLDSVLNECSKLILDNPVEAVHSGTDLYIWRQVIHKRVEELRSHIKQLVLAGDVASTVDPSRTLLSFLDSCQHFLGSLLASLVSSYAPPGLHMFPSDVIPDAFRCNDIAAPKLIAYRLNSFLGDIARYRIMHQDSLPLAMKDWTTALTSYNAASTLLPGMGHPHNQRAIIATYCRQDCSALYSYVRCLGATSPFGTSAENMKLLLKDYSTGKSGHPVLGFAASVLFGSGVMEREVTTHTAEHVTALFSTCADSQDCDVCLTVLLFCLAWEHSPAASSASLSHACLHMLVLAFSCASTVVLASAQSEALGYVVALCEFFLEHPTTRQLLITAADTLHALCPLQWTSLWTNVCGIANKAGATRPRQGCTLRHDSLPELRAFGGFLGMFSSGRIGSLSALSHETFRIKLICDFLDHVSSLVSYNSASMRYLPGIAAFADATSTGSPSAWQVSLTNEDVFGRQSSPVLSPSAVASQHSGHTGEHPSSVTVFGNHPMDVDTGAIGVELRNAFVFVPLSQ